MKKVFINQLIDYKKTPLNKEDLKELVEKLKETMTYREMAKETGIPRANLYRMAKPEKTKCYHNYIIDLKRIEGYFEDFVPTGIEIERIKKLIIKLNEMVGGIE